MNFVELMGFMIYKNTLPRKRFKIDRDYIRSHSIDFDASHPMIVPMTFECEKYETWKTNISYPKPTASLFPNINTGDFKN